MALATPELSTDSSYVVAVLLTENVSVKTAGWPVVLVYVFGPKAANFVTVLTE